MSQPVAESVEALDVGNDVPGNRMESPNVAELLHEMKLLYDMVIEYAKLLRSPQLGKGPLVTKIVTTHLATQKLVNESVPNNHLPSNNLVSRSLKIDSPSLRVVGRDVVIVEVELCANVLKLPYQGSLFFCECGSLH